MRHDFTYLVALLAIRTGIPHSEFINMDRSLLLATLAVLKDDAKRTENASRGRRTR
jgi:hypothetical protein